MTLGGKGTEILPSKLVCGDLIEDQDQKILRLTETEVGWVGRNLGHVQIGLTFEGSPSLRNKGPRVFPGINIPRD